MYNQPDIEVFEREVQAEIRSLLHYPYPHLDEISIRFQYSLHSLARDMDERPRGRIPARKHLYAAIHRELERSRFRLNKQTIRDLLVRLEEDDEHSWKTYNELLSEELKKTLSAYWLDRIRGEDERRERARIEATKVMSLRNFRKYVCPALQTVTDDAHDIAKIMIPILIPLALAGTIPIPLQPIVVAQVALTIARMGVASLCEGFSEKDKK